MIQILELPDREFKITLIKMLTTLIKRVDNVQEQISNASRKMEMLRIC